MMKATEHRRSLLPGGRIKHGKTDETACITVGLVLALDKLERITKKLQRWMIPCFIFPSMSSKQGNHILYPDVFHSLSLVRGNVVVTRSHRI